MADRTGSVERIALEMGNALGEVQRLLSPEETLRTIAEFGVAFPPDLLAHPGFAAARTATVTAAGDLRTAMQDLVAAIASEDAVQIVAQGARTLEAAARVTGSFTDLRAQLLIAGPTMPGVTPAQVTELTTDLPDKLFDFLVVEQLDAVRAVGASLTFLGLIERTYHPADPANPTSTAYETARLRFDRIGPLLTGPAKHFKDLYDWGDPAFDGDKLLRAVDQLVARMGLPSRFEPASGGQPARAEAFALGLTAAPGSPPGLDVDLLLSIGGGIDRDIALPHPAWTGHVKATAAAAAGGGGRIRPPLEITLRPVTGEIGGEVDLSVLGRPAEPFVLIGVAGGSRLEIGQIDVDMGFDIAWNVAAGEARLAPRIVGRIRQGKVVIDTSQADGFISKLLSGFGLEATFDVGMTWGSETGVRFEGSSTLEIALPMHVEIGPIKVAALYLMLGFNNGAFPLELSADMSAQLGPLDAVASRVGVSAELSFPPGGGNVGPARLTFAFKPPDGAALSIDAGPVTGGGFLFFDPARELYAGGLHLEFEKLTLDAIGLLTTRMPDGSRGFSLLVIVRASGFAPIPLGFGFSLTGVGGLLGINRTVALDVLRAGVRNRTLDSILFSKDDPTPRAPQIVSTLQTVFPPAAGRYVFGPMAQIGWGPPNAPVLLIEVALLLELPAPLRLIILGRIRAGLPQPDKAIVKLNLDVVGIIDFDRRELSVDATLFDSFVGPFALTGDMAARANWGDRPDFALSLGGFHPAFKPPAGFPALRRLALTLSTGDNPRLRMEAYLALTSNTVQLGARLDFYVAVAGFSLDGGFGFDALIQLSPFRLQAELDAGLTLKRGSRTLMHLGIHVNIVGPSPWEVWGEAKFKLLFVSITVPFRARFGRPEALPEAERTDVWKLLNEELKKPENWRAELPAADNRLATLIGEPALGEALAHPLGALSVNQRSVPLERTLSMFGTAPPREATYFEITSAAGLDRGDDLHDWFAPAQYRRMSDAEKLSSPAFDRMVSGAALGPAGDAVAVGTVKETPLDYETAVVLDLEDPTREKSDAYAPPEDAVASLAERGPAGVAELRDQGRAKFAPEEPGPRVKDAEYVVASRATLEVVETTDDGSYSAAVEAVRGSTDRDGLQVVRREETELALA